MSSEEAVHVSLMDIRRRGVRAPALEPWDEGKGSWTKYQGFKPDLRNSAVRHYRGATGNVATVGL
jgi:hypothetical protein